MDPRDATPPGEAPVACTLSHADLPQRLADARSLGGDALVAVEVADRAALLRFDGELERLQALVAAETKCCPFLDISLCRAGELVELSIHAPEGAESVLRGLVAAVVAGWEGGL